VERLGDNISYLMHTEGAGEIQTGIEGRLDAVRKMLDEIHEKYIKGALKR